jgi:hypothetical protein
MNTYTRQAAFTELRDFDCLAKPHDFMEVTLWHNGEGFDVTISDDQHFTLSWGQYKALKKLVKAADK